MSDVRVVLRGEVGLVLCREVEVVLRGEEIFKERRGGGVYIGEGGCWKFALVNRPPATGDRRQARDSTIAIARLSAVAMRVMEGLGEWNRGDSRRRVVILGHV